MTRQYAVQVFVCCGLMLALYWPIVERQEIQGRIVEVSPQEIVLRADGAKTPICIASDADITLNGCPVRLDDLAPVRHTARIALRWRENQWVATKVYAWSYKIRENPLRPSTLLSQFQRLDLGHGSG